MSFLEIFLDFICPVILFLNHTPLRSVDSERGSEHQDVVSHDDSLTCSVTYMASTHCKFVANPMEIVFCVL